MKKRKWVIIFLDDEIQLLCEKKEYRFIDKESLCFGKIANPQLFISHFLDFLKQNKLKRSLFGDNLQIIHNPFWTKADETIANATFNYLGFSTITFMNETSLLEVKENTLWIHHCKSYITIYFLEENYQKIIYIDKEQKLMQKEVVLILKQLIKKYHNIHTIYLIGSEKEIQETIEKSTKIPTYLLPSKNNYFILQAKK